MGFAYGDWVDVPGYDYSDQLTAVPTSADSSISALESDPDAPTDDIYPAYRWDSLGTTAPWAPYRAQGKIFYAKTQVSNSSPQQPWPAGAIAYQFQGPPAVSDFMLRSQVSVAVAFAESETITVEGQSRLVDPAVVSEFLSSGVSPGTAGAAPGDFVLDSRVLTSTGTAGSGSSVDQILSVDGHYGSYESDQITDYTYYDETGAPHTYPVTLQQVLLGVGVYPFLVWPGYVYSLQSVDVELPVVVGESRPAGTYLIDCSMHVSPSPYRFVYYVPDALPHCRLYPREDRYGPSPRMYPLPASRQTPGRLTGYL